MTKQEFLAMSLPYELHSIIQNRVALINGIEYEKELPITWRGEKFTGKSDFNIKPILHPLTDLTKEIEHNGEKFVPLHRLLENNYFDLTQMSEEDVLAYEGEFMMPELITLYDLLLYLEWHFDICGLIGKGEAIDVNTLDENPYK